MNMNFRWKIITMYILTAIIPISILGVYSWSMATENLQNQTIKTNEQILQQASESINNSVSRIWGIVQTIGADYNLSNAFYENYKSYYDVYQAITYYIDPYFASVRGANPEIGNIYIITNNPAFVSRTPSIIRKDSLAKDKWIDQASSSFDPLWFYDKSIIKKTNTGKFYTTLFCVRRIVGSIPGDINNFLYVEVKPDNLFGILKTVQPNSGFIVLNNDNNIIYHAKSTSPTLTDADLRKIADSKNNRICSSGRIWFSDVRPLSITGYRLVYFTSWDITSSSSKIIWLTVVLFLASLLIMSVLIYYSSKAIVRRLDAFEKKAERIAAGDFSVDLSSAYNDEIGKLGNIFDSMLRSIQDLIEKVYKSEIKSREAEMKALQAQINPHFLYNVLSLINSIALKERSYAISRLTTTISSYYRAMLSKDSTIISIKSELENLRIYTDIQLLLNNNKFDVLYDIDEEVLRYNTINIMLQPIVENAIEHGLNDLQGKRGSILISAKVYGSDILFTVQDNGLGIDQNAIEEVLIKHTKGYGLNNVQSRIKYLYGEEYGITIYSNEGNGTVVNVRIPCKENK